MECKFYWVFPRNIDLGELIDTLWNVNSIFYCEESGRSSELIDTLWNVNYIYVKKIEGWKDELIDSLWNVNVLHTPAACIFIQRINRYIIECKR